MREMRGTWVVFRFVVVVVLLGLFFFKARFTSKTLLVVTSGNAPLLSRFSLVSRLSLSLSLSSKLSGTNLNKVARSQRPCPV